MSRVLAFHGVAPHVDRGGFAFRNLCSAAAFEGFLASTPKFVALSEALAGGGDALTIDDATRAGSAAAWLARKHGHAVTLFVNPGQVESGAPYAFLALNAVLDGLDGHPKTFEGRTFATSTTAERQELRRAIKAVLCATEDEAARLDLVRRLGVEWRVGRLEVPPHFSTLDKRELIELRDGGVDLQNHGWFHTDHAMLSVEASHREVSEGRAWLRRELALDAKYFAAPFGNALPLPGAADACDVWFTVSDTIPAGPHGARVFNRETPNIPDSDGGPRRVSVGRIVGAWTARLLAALRRA